MLSSKQALDIIDLERLNNNEILKSFLKKNKNSYSLEDLSLIIELSNNKRVKHSAYYTNFFIIEEIFKTLPDFNKKEITIIEPSVGSGNFIPFLFEKYKFQKRVNLILIDIDENIINLLKVLYTKECVPNNFNIQFCCEDFLNYKSDKVDLIVGNPPFTKIKTSNKKIYNSHNYSRKMMNLAGLFLEKAVQISDYVSLVMPKNILNTDEYSETRSILKQLNLTHILDFGESGFKGVLIETVSLCVNSSGKSNYIDIYSFNKNETIRQVKNYILDCKLPYWVIYRNDFFDKIFDKINFDVFDVFRDRQITNSNSSLEKIYESDIRILKSRNIDDQGENIKYLEGYDAYISSDSLTSFAVKKYLNSENVYITPNMTYKPRLMKKPKGCLVNGSVAILKPKFDFVMTKQQMKYIASEEFRSFYKIARNFQTRSLNVDKTSCYWFGIHKDVLDE